MASSALRLFPLFILLTIISSARARDSQFFSKVSRDNLDHVQETQLPNDSKNVDVTKAQEGEPTFIPQTNEHGYGLYGHETGHKYPSTDTQTPYTTTAKTAEYEEPTFYGNKDSKAYSHDEEENRERGVKAGEELPQKRSGYFYTGNDSEEKKNFAEELHGLDETRLTGSGYTTGEDQKGASSSSSINNGGYKYNGGEKTGMSDTRYLENGRYFHDISSENKVNQQPNFYDTMRNDKYNSNDRYSGYYYYGNKDDNSNGYDRYNGNTNSKDQGNTMPYYQYNSNQGNSAAYGGGGYYNKDGDNYNKDNNYFNNDNNNNNNMGGYQYQHKGNNYNNQGQEEFEFDP